MHVALEQRKVCPASKIFQIFQDPFDRVRHYCRWLKRFKSRVCLLSSPQYRTDNSIIVYYWSSSNVYHSVLYNHAARQIQCFYKWLIVRGQTLTPVAHHAFNAAFIILHARHAICVIIPITTVTACHLYDNFNNFTYWIYYDDLSFANACSVPFCFTATSLAFQYSWHTTCNIVYTVRVAFYIKIISIRSNMRCCRVLTVYKKVIKSGCIAVMMTFL